MRINTKFKSLILGLALTGFVFGGCTKYASEEDLQALENQKQAALSAEQRVEELKSTKTDLERQVREKQNDLNEAKRILDEVRR
ncbi:MAG: hypothetical protein GY863_22690 [bacterium]|nr:hypothetical protein [bacterium]